LIGSSLIRIDHQKRTNRKCSKSTQEYSDKLSWPVGRAEMVPSHPTSHPRACSACGLRAFSPATREHGPTSRPHVLQQNLECVGYVYPWLAFGRVESLRHLVAESLVRHPQRRCPLVFQPQQAPCVSGGSSRDGRSSRAAIVTGERPRSVRMYSVNAALACRRKRPRTSAYGPAR
jgi:hypothetical protein